MILTITLYCINLKIFERFKNPQRIFKYTNGVSVNEVIFCSDYKLKYKYINLILKRKYIREIFEILPKNKEMKKICEHVNFYICER
ncbi:MAG: hypothetical protein CVT88_04470 [Candidatus Altiarchaeales archaeon HGW-Altiarchaeales-1]|nr:MAG: hypothetical protein CVT88_04470 [Candidatus Altiarchaeales archaeon HGW-Altiarchaeales-1]